MKNNIININKQKDTLVFLIFLSLSLLIMSFSFEPIYQVYKGYLEILTSTSNLLTDYFYLGGIGATFFNAFSILIFSILTSRLAKKEINGAEIAAIILVTGFAFLGKNLINAFPLTLGVFIYSKYFKIDKSAVVLQSLYITALGPLISEIIFNFGFSLPIGIILGYLTGIIIGFITTPLSRSFLRFHNGYNLYNIGFTAGIIGMLFVAIFRMFGYKIESVSLLYNYNNPKVISYLLIIFLLMIIYGFIKNDFSFKGYSNILKSSGRLPSDFIITYGFYPTLINMGLMGIISMLLVFLFKGVFNGPVIGGILSVTAFAAFGKHPKNAFPIMVGVYLASLINIFDQSSTASIIAGLFGTSLSPISGRFGPLAGILAGFLHVAMVFNVGVLYGGANLYNNGFSGGFIAAILVPILEDFQQLEIIEKGEKNE